HFTFSLSLHVALPIYFRSVSNGSYLPPANSSVWDDAYTGIRATNYLLQKAVESGLGAQIDRWVGEARFFRAYHYWNLVKTYGGRSEEHTSELQSLAYL